jgi:hypothetical protein
MTGVWLRDITWGSAPPPSLDRWTDNQLDRQTDSCNCRQRQRQQKAKETKSDEDKLSYTEMQTTIQKLVVNAESKGFGDATILLHRFSAELRKSQQKKSTGDGRITNFFKKVKDP